MLVYNGIPMQLLKTNVIDRQAVYDESGTDYLYTRWMISVICLYNPGWMMAPAVRFPKGDADAVLQGNPGDRPKGDIDPREQERVKPLRVYPGQQIPTDFKEEIERLLLEGGFPNFFPKHLLRGAVITGEEDTLVINPQIDNDSLFRFQKFLEWIGSVTRPGVPPNQFWEDFGPFPNVAQNPPDDPAPGPHGILDGQGPPGNEILGPGPWSPVETDYALRHHLMQPRRQLILLWDSGLKVGFPLTEAMLISPLAGYQTDALNGPKPHHCDIQRVAGEARTFIVHYTIETNLNECGEGASREKDAPVMLSNRWTMHYDIDHDYYTTQTVDGVAHFRTDLLLGVGEFGALPDDLRSEFYFPIPHGFKREHIQVAATPDGSAVMYRFQDREVAKKLDKAVVGPRVSRVAGAHKLSLVSNFDALGGTLDVYRDVLAIQSNYHYYKQAKEHHENTRRAKGQGQDNEPLPPGSQTRIQPQE